MPMEVVQVEDRLSGVARVGPANVTGLRFADRARMPRTLFEIFPSRPPNHQATPIRLTNETPVSRDTAYLKEFGGKHPCNKRR
jgi:hypothetical protein